MSSLAYDLKIVSIKSGKLFEVLVRYVVDNGWSEHDLAAQGDRTTTNFINSVAYCYGDLKNEQFFALVKRYAVLRIDYLGKFKLLKLLDIYKFS